MASVLIALGGNVGDVRTTFGKAIANICGMTQAALVARSSDYATPPWGDEDQPPFINACIEIDTRSIRMRCCSCCTRSSRNSAATAPKERRWGPRTLDLDMIAYDDMSIDKVELTLPHPRLFERAFVLVPLAEIAPDRLIARPPRSRTRWRTSRPRGSSGCRIGTRHTKQPFGLAVPTWQFPAKH